LGKYRIWHAEKYPQSGPAAPMMDMPHDWIWGEFLEKMHWTDKAVLDRQETWFVRQQHRFYQLKREYGLLGG
jgi:hypothetical protein